MRVSISKSLPLILGLALMTPILPAAVVAQTTASASANPATPFVATEAAEAVEALAKQLEDNFVFPETGKRYAATLRAKLGSGGYANFASAEEFARAVTDDLQAVEKDGHLRLFAPGTPGAQPRRASQGNGTPPKGLVNFGWIAPGVAYIRFNGFYGDPESLKELEAFLKTHADAKSVIIDARTHRGGGAEEMDLMFPYFFKERTLLVTMDARRAAEEAQGALFPDSETFVRASGPEGVIRRNHFAIPAAKQNGLKDARIFLLTSKRTASAAEHLSLALKRTGRGILIGEATAGANHFGGRQALPGGYSAFIPVGRTSDPETGEDWEGKGIVPDILVPADEALAVALRRAGVDPAKANLAIAG